MNKKPAQKIHQRMNFLPSLPIGDTDTQAFATSYLKRLSEHDARALIHYLRVWVSDPCWQVEDCPATLAHHADFLALYGVWVQIDRIAKQLSYDFKQLEAAEAAHVHQDKHLMLLKPISIGDFVAATADLVVPAISDRVGGEYVPEKPLASKGDVLCVLGFGRDFQLYVCHKPESPKTEWWLCRPSQVELLDRCIDRDCAWRGRLFNAVYRGDQILCPLCRAVLKDQG